MDKEISNGIDRTSSPKDQLLEDISDLCHQEWMDWSQNISNDFNKILSVLKENSLFLNQSLENNEASDLKKETDDMIEYLENKLQRWQSLWIPYDGLSEEMKDLDRIYAQKILDLMD